MKQIGQHTKTREIQAMKMMRNTAMTLGLLCLAACAGNRDLVKTASTGTNHDVFQEITSGSAAASGYADLQVYASLKTHRPGIYSANDAHGTADYKMVLNIDGQVVEMAADLRGESIEAGMFPDPEAGEGVRYLFKKSIRVKPGTRKVVIAIPADDLALEHQVTFTEGKSHVIAVKPMYGSKPGQQRPGYGSNSFTEGIKGLWMILNGKTL